MIFRRTLALIPLVSLLASPLLAQAPSRSPLVARVGERGFLQAQAPSFSKLPVNQKLVAYHLYQAAVQLDPIFYDQMSAYGLTAKRLLGALVEDPERLPEASRQAIVDYAMLFFGSNGNHNETTGEKFLPAFSFEQFSQAAEQARAKGARLGTQAQLAQTLQSLRTPLFDPAFQLQLTAKNPPQGEDILTASSNNYYQGVKLGRAPGVHGEEPAELPAGRAATASWSRRSTGPARRTARSRPGTTPGS